MTDTQFAFDRQIEVANVMDLAHFILTKNCSSLLAAELQQRDFVSVLVRCVFGDLNTPCVLANYAIDLVRKTNLGLCKKKD